MLTQLASDRLGRRPLRHLQAARKLQEADRSEGISGQECGRRAVHRRWFVAPLATAGVLLLTGIDSSHQAVDVGSSCNRS